MDEKEEIKEVKEEATVEDTPKGDKPEGPDDIDRTNEASERMERNLDRKDKQLAREEKLEVSRRLGGRSEAGAEPVKEKEETPEEYSKRISENDLKDGEG